MLSREGALKYRLAQWFEPIWARRARAAIAGRPIEGWIDIDAFSAAVFTVALAEQLPPGHRLCDRRWRAIARVDGLDDMLYLSRDGQCAAVHLTWQKERDPRWPRCAVVASLDEARERFAD